MKIFQRQYKIRFGDTDAAGVMYFARIFPIAHDMFEEFIVEAGLPWEKWFKTNDYFVPIRHAECNYQSPFFPGETYQVQVQVEFISQSTFGMIYTFTQGSKTHGIVRMAHTFVNPTTRRKTALPKKIQDVLTPYLRLEVKV